MLYTHTLCQVGLIVSSPFLAVAACLDNSLPSCSLSIPILLLLPLSPSFSSPSPLPAPPPLPSPPLPPPPSPSISSPLSPPLPSTSSLSPPPPLPPPLYILSSLSPSPLYLLALPPLPPLPSPSHHYHIGSHLLLQDCCCPGSGCHTRGTTCSHHHLLGSRHQAHGKEERHSAQPSLCGDPGLHFGHLLGQDRDPHHQHDVCQESK